MRNIFRRAEPEQTSGDIVSLQHSSKASERPAAAVTNNVIMMTTMATSVQRDIVDNPVNPFTREEVQEQGPWAPPAISLPDSLNM